ncbi:MAG: class I SAM-dependent methyltransferase [Saprospiraceae bacterium]|nr:class I SAM-dependent methyltransferase [Lewinella sp.]
MALTTIGKKEIWNYWAPRYEKLWSQHFALGPSRNLIHDHLAASDFQPNRILDIGCGVGQLAYELATRWPKAEVVAADYSAGMIARAKRDYAAPNITHIHGSLEDIPNHKPFDLIVSTNAFPYFPDKNLAARQMWKLLAPNGRTLIVQANHNNFYDALWLIFVKLTVSQAEYLSVEDLKEVLQQAGFTIGKVRPISTAFFIPSVFLVEGVRS